MAVGFIRNRLGAASQWETLLTLSLDETRNPIIKKEL